MAVLILFLAFLWAAALIPTFVRKAAEYRLDVSVSRFRSSTTLLKRAQSVDRASEPTGLDPAKMTAINASRAAVERTRARRRIKQRIHVLRALGIATGSTFLIGVVPPLRPLWYVSLIALLSGIAYVGALFYVTRQQIVMTERARKVVALPRPSDRTGDLGARGQIFVAVGGGSLMAPSVQERRPAFRIVKAPS